MPGFFLESHTIQNKTFDFLGVQGTVLEGKSWNETYVSGGGGGGAMLNGMGSMHTAPIKTTVVTRNEIWLDTGNGKEMNIAASNVHFPVRNGHRVSAILGECKGHDNTYPVLLINHTTGRYAPIPVNVGYVLGNVKLLKNPKILAISLVLGPLVGLLTLGIVGAVVGLVAGPIIGKTLYKKAQMKDLLAHVEKLGQGIQPLEEQDATPATGEANPQPA